MNTQAQPKYCPHCGLEIQLPKSKVCTKCRTPVAAEWLYCIVCGAACHPVSEPEQEGVVAVPISEPPQSTGETEGYPTNITLPPGAISWINKMASATNMTRPHWVLCCVKDLEEHTPPVPVQKGWRNCSLWFTRDEHFSLMVKAKARGMSKAELLRTAIIDAHDDATKGGKR